MHVNLVEIAQIGLKNNQVILCSRDQALSTSTGVAPEFTYEEDSRHY